ncbi:MAG: PQQ-binding-like beta-propeller repeat protein [Halodesulfurarchaeum sp.]|nr:PQQ-binding-like beta-propeller repeat protein [Halodesulfurarchaeum sp.]
MALRRRDFLARAAGLLATASLTALAGCASSCPDSGRPTAEETVSIDSPPTGPFERTPTGTWPAETGNSANTGYTQRSLPESGLSVRWSTQLDIPTEDGVGVVASTPVVGSERASVADPERVHAVSLRTGETEWESERLPVTQTEHYGTYRPETIAPRVGPEGRILVGLESGLAALDPNDGSTVWNVAGLSAVGPPTVAGDLLVAQGERTVRAFDPDGTERWETEITRDATRRQPTATGEVVVLRTDTGLEALDPATGETRWSRRVQAESQPAIDDGIVFLGTDEGLLGLDATDGTDRFAYSRGDYMAFHSLVVAPETVYVVEQPPEAGASSFALSRTTDGVEPRWCSSIGDGSVTAATDHRALGRFELGTGPGAARSVASFTADAGAVDWAIEGGSRSDTWLNPPALLEGVLVLTTRGGRVLAVSRGD